MTNPDCPGKPPFVCIGGWLYTQMSNAMMIFPTNRLCPLCHPERYPDPAQPEQIANDYETTG